MQNIIRLVKINLLSFFDISKIRNAKDKKERNTSIMKTILIIGVFILLGYYLYDFAELGMQGFIQMNIPYVILAEYMALSSIYILFVNIYKVNGLLFNFKDYNLLMSLPIKRSHIISSKLIIMYITNLIYVLLFMIPVYIVYITSVAITPIFHVLYFLTLFIIPIVPIIVAGIIGAIITFIASKFKKHSFANIIVSLLFMFGVMFISYKLPNAQSIDIANIGKSIVDTFNNIYPLTNTYMNIMNNNDLISLLIFILIPIILFTLFVLILNKKYMQINSKLNSTYAKSNYKFNKTKSNSPVIALYKKEIKRYFSSSNYVLNTAIGAIMLTMAVIVFVIFGQGKIDEMLDIPGLSEAFINLSPIVLAAFCAMTSTTHSSISLEGKNFWIIKSLPVKPITIFLSKILVNLTVLVPFIIINATILAVYLKANLFIIAFMFITPIVYSIFTAILGLILNIYFCKLNWTNEIYVIKQSLPPLLNMVIGILLAIVPFTIERTISDNLFIVLLTAGVATLDAILYLFMATVAQKKFEKIN